MTSNTPAQAAAPSAHARTSLMAERVSDRAISSARYRSASTAEACSFANGLSPLRASAPAQKDPSGACPCYDARWAPGKLTPSTGLFTRQQRWQCPRADLSTGSPALPTAPSMACRARHDTTRSMCRPLASRTPAPSGQMLAEGSRQLNARDVLPGSISGGGERGRRTGAHWGSRLGPRERRCRCLAELPAQVGRQRRVGRAQQRDRRAGLARAPRAAHTVHVRLSRHAPPGVTPKPSPLSTTTTRTQRTTTSLAVSLARKGRSRGFPKP